MYVVGDAESLQYSNNKCLYTYILLTKLSIKPADHQIKSVQYVQITQITVMCRSLQLHRSSRSFMCAVISQLGLLQAQQAQVLKLGVQSSSSISSSSKGSLSRSSFSVIRSTNSCRCSGNSFTASMYKPWCAHGHVNAQAKFTLTHKRTGKKGEFKN